MSHELCVLIVKLLYTDISRELKSRRITDKLCSTHEMSNLYTALDE
jgi:hypothetical protein